MKQRNKSQVNEKLFLSITPTNASWKDNLES